jgi:membrane-bound lytic murein transglycosylase D
MLFRCMALAGALVLSTQAWAENDLWGRIRSGFALPEQQGKYVAALEKKYRSNPQAVEAVLSRARRYLFYIVDEVERRGMPTELALLPMVESQFDPMAVSPAEAAGLWQFVPATGLRYGLAQDEHYDARRDILSSTGAALDYLQFLFDLYGDWRLALVAYNSGEGTVSRAISASRARGEDGSYERLRLPAETRKYLPRLQAIKNLIAEPESFAIELGELPNAPYFSTITLERSIPLAVAARLAGLPLQELVLLNPGWTAPTARRGATLVLPVDRAAAFHANYARIAKVASQRSKKPALPELLSYREDKAIKLQ